MISTREFTYDSRDGRSKVYAYEWKPSEDKMPDGKPVCILQIVHGMTEHIGRYDEFARYLAQRGILVCGNDHLGHGNTVNADQICGYFCANDPATVVVRDVHRLKKMTQQQYPGVPYIILGHSMGSFILRNYLVKYGTGIDGAILSGTGFMSGALLKAGSFVTKLFGGINKGRNESKMLHKFAFGKYLSRIENPKTQKDWLCKDEEIIQKYLDDPKCQFNFTGNGYQTLLELTKRANDEKAWQAIPKKLPILIVSGTEDPVGDWGEGPQKLYDAFINVDLTKTQLKLYNKDRHEVLNELDREVVFEDLYNWMQGVVGRMM